MNKGTGDNIMTQLGITSDEYNLVQVLYYVSFRFGVTACCWIVTDQMKYIGPLHRSGSAVESAAKALLPFEMAVPNYDQLGYLLVVQCRSEE
jgi:hypothetical protein